MVTVVVAGGIMVYTFGAGNHDEVLSEGCDIVGGLGTTNL